jgi:hypothetical protein
VQAVQAVLVLLCFVILILFLQQMLPMAHQQ